MTLYNGVFQKAIKYKEEKENQAEQNLSANSELCKHPAANYIVFMILKNTT